MPTDAVTGATSYTGRFIADRLRADGRLVIDLTRRPAGVSDRAPDLIEAPFPAPNPAELARSLEGVDTLYDTHWIRLERGDVTYARAVATIRTLLEAARSAGVRRVVHISVVHASLDAPTRYFRAKAQAEELVRALAPSHAIVRPTVTFGPADILLNNLAWTLRRLPVFGIPGDGRYPIQPVHVEDIARIAVESAGRAENVVVDAAGPERFAFGDFVRVVREALGSKAFVLSMPVPFALSAARLIGLFVRDVVLVRDEVTELRTGLMVSDAPALGQIRFSDWVRAHADELGRRWSSELARHYRLPSRSEGPPGRV